MLRFSRKVDECKPLPAPPLPTPVSTIPVPPPHPTPPPKAVPAVGDPPPAVGDPPPDGGDAFAAPPEDGPSPRGLHSSTFRLNLSAFCGIGVHPEIV